MRKFYEALQKASSDKAIAEQKLRDLIAKHQRVLAGYKALQKETEDRAGMLGPAGKAYMLGRLQLMGVRELHECFSDIKALVKLRVQEIEAANKAREEEDSKVKEEEMPPKDDDEELAPSSLRARDT